METSWTTHLLCTSWKFPGLGNFPWEQVWIGVETAWGHLGLKGWDDKEARYKYQLERPGQALPLPHSPTSCFAFPGPTCTTVTPTTCALWFFKIGVLYLPPMSSGVQWRQPRCNSTEPIPWVWGPTLLLTVGSVWPWVISQATSCTHFCPNHLTLSVSIDMVTDK